MSPLGVIFAVILCFTIVYCHPIAEPQPEPALPVLIPVGTFVAEKLLETEGGKQFVEDAKTWVAGAAVTVKDKVVDAWQSVKDFFG